MRHIYVNRFRPWSGVIPPSVPRTEREALRLVHADLPGRTALELWSERRLVEEAIAVRVHSRARPGWLRRGPTENDVIALDAWLIERRQRLAAEEHRHRRSTGAAA